MVSYRNLYHFRVPSSLNILTVSSLPTGLPPEGKGLPVKAFVATQDADWLVRMNKVAEPTPAPDEAVVAVEAYSVNRGETFVLEQAAAGWRPGKDVSGIVTRVAADGSGPAVGVRVVAHPASGGWAERVAVPTRGIAVLPDDVSFQAAAALPLAGLTALRLSRVAGAMAGRRMLMTGASGGVGHYFTELAADAGAALTVVTATPERGERLRDLGARHVVHHVADAIGPFDVVLESVGGATLPVALSKLAARGTLIWFGQASRTPAEVSFFRFWEGPVSGTIRHFDYTDTETSDADDLAALVGMVAAGLLHPEIGLAVDWSETPEALNRLRNRGVRGNVVLTLA